MKGPGLRIDLDVRRIWRCAKCGKTLRTPAHVVAQRCGCSEVSPWMILQVPPKREPFQPPVREPLPETDGAPAEPVLPPPNENLVPSESPPAEPVAASSPVAAGPPAAEPVSARAEAAPVEPPPGVSSVPATPPPDEFGAGLGDAAPK